MVTMPLKEPRRSHGQAESGYILLGVMLLLGLLIISLSVALPRIIHDVQRDRELETIHRGLQYRRAIQLYYRKYHRYPPSVDALRKTDNLRFLRKSYIDPITGKDDWVPIQFGQNKVPTVFAFFGQPANMAAMPGAGGGGGLGLSGSPGYNLVNASTVTSRPVSTNPGGQTFGGEGIIGVSLPTDKRSVVVYKKQDRYNLWEFVYDPLQEYGLPPAAASGPGAIASNPGQPGPGPGSVPPPPVGGGYTPPPPPVGWGPNGNLPTPGDPGDPTQPWSPNGNLPSPPPQ